MPLFAGPGVTPSLRGLATNVFTLQAGEVFTIPAGWFSPKPGRYTVLQEYDPITTIWRSIGAGPSSAHMELMYSDGTNYRFANQTGCCVAARVVVAGSGYTSAPTCTAGSGSSIWRCIVGGAVSTSVTVSNGGSNYTYPPTVLFSAPPTPGVQATGYCTLTSGAVSSVTITDQGAGYSSPPTISFINDPREGVNSVTQGFNAAAVATLTGAGTVTAVVCLDHGTALTSVPALTISGGGGSNATAVAIMNFTLTAYTISGNSSGAGYFGSVLISAFGGYTTSTAAYTNPTIEQSPYRGRQALIVGALTGSALTVTGQSVSDGGSYPGVPTIISYYNSPPATGAAMGASVGGATDVCVLLTT